LSLQFLPSLERFVTALPGIIVFLIFRMVRQFIVLELLNKGLGGLVVLPLKNAKGLLDPLDGIFAYVQFPGQRYLLFIVRHGFPPTLD
jgi:hypothetical protein